MSVYVEEEEENERMKEERIGYLMDLNEILNEGDEE